MFVPQVELLDVMRRLCEPLLLELRRLLEEKREEELEREEEQQQEEEKQDQGKEEGLEEEELVLRRLLEEKQEEEEEDEQEVHEGGEQQVTHINTDSEVCFMTVELKDQDEKAELIYLTKLISVCSVPSTPDQVEGAWLC